MQEEFEYYTHIAFKQLPDEFKQKLDNVAIFIEDYHPQAPHTLLGLYEGIPQTKRSNYGIGGPLPDKITLFKYPILYLARDQKHLAKLIKDTLFHEIGHHFGLNEEEIRNAQKDY